MPSARQRLRESFGTLRFRLTVWNTAVMLLMVLFTLWGVREGLRYVLWREADKQLVEDAREVLLTYEQLFPDLAQIQQELDRKAITHTHRGLHIRVFDGDRRLSWTSANAPPEAFAVDLFRHGLNPVTAGQYRLVHVATSRPGIPPATLRVGTSFEPLENDVALLTELLIVVGGAALLVTPLGGYWMAGRATRPIAQIIDTTRRLDPASLNERLTLRGSLDELDRLSATINGFLDRMAEYVEQKRAFTANAAHELRTPLAAIQNSLEVTLNAERSVEEYQQQLAEVLDRCDSLRHLVNQLLLLAENDAHTLPTVDGPVVFDEVVSRALDMFQGAAEAAGVTLNRGRIEPVRMRGDAARLRQVVNNLLDNAIKFTPSGGAVSVSLIAAAPGGDACLTVRDTGIGIPEADLPRLFERFFRGDKSRHRGRASSGTGLGLAICQSIVAAHRGRICVESRPQQGTAVTVQLPAVRVGDDPLEPVAAADVAGRSSPLNPAAALPPTRD